MSYFLGTMNNLVALFFPYRNGPPKPWYAYIGPSHSVIFSWLHRDPDALWALSPHNISAGQEKRGYALKPVVF